MPEIQQQFIVLGLMKANLILAPPFEPEFYAEFESEGPGASFFDFDVVLNDFH